MPQKGIASTHEAMLPSRRQRYRRDHQRRERCNAYWRGARFKHFKRAGCGLRLFHGSCPDDPDHDQPGDSQPDLYLDQIKRFCAKCRSFGISICDFSGQRSKIHFVEKYRKGIIIHMCRVQTLASRPLTSSRPMVAPSRLCILTADVRKPPR